MEAEREVEDFCAKAKAKFAADQARKKQRCMRSDVEAAIFMAANALASSPENQSEIGLSKSQYCKRVQQIKAGPHRTVVVSVRCQDCSRYLRRITDIVIPLFDMKCDCDH